MTEPVVVTAVFTPVEGSFDRLRDVLSRAIAEVHEESGCLLYAIHADPAGRIVMIEKWESAELLDEHGSGEPVRRLNAAIAPLIAQPVEVTRLRPLPAGTASQGQL